MNRFIERLNDAAAAWAPTMFAVVWQSTVLAALVAAALWALRRQSPRVRYALLLFLAAKLLAMPFWSVGIAWPWSSASVATPSPAVEPSTPTVAVPAPAVETSSPTDSLAAPVVASVASPARARLTWQAWLMALWLAVIVAEVVRTARQFRRLRRLLADSRPAPPQFAALVANCARLLGLKTAPAAREIEGEGSPFVSGLIRPRLVLPAATLTSFDVPALRQIVLHELAHVRRKDLWTLWIVHAMRTLYWFHPVAHWIAYRAGLERELACDQLAIARSGATAGAYAQTLVRAAGSTSQPLALTAAVAAKLDGGHAD